MSFVARLDGAGEEADASAAIISAIMGVAGALNLRTVAEGIETPRQLASVTALGCDLGQGFLLGRPAGREDVRRASPGTISCRGAAGVAPPERHSPDDDGAGV
jgi:EAL domain-containing protein (putative c-di-GMP-specific phosphodiesterase class I)